MNRPNPLNDPRSSLSLDTVSQAAPAEATQAPAPRVLDATLEQAARRFAVKRDEASFAVLYGAAQRPMKDALYGAGVCAQDLDDVVSCAGATLWTLRSTFKGRSYGEFAAFGIGVAQRKAMTWLRTERRRNRIVILPGEASETDDDIEDTLADSAATPEDIAAAREALRLLSPREREVVRARAEGCTWPEIAEATGVSVTRVRVLHERAVERLRGDG
jgi:RNA polymerase sigma factor (sigma-70 family)